MEDARDRVPSRLLAHLVLEMDVEFVVDQRAVFDDGDEIDLAAEDAVCYAGGVGRLLRNIYNYRIIIDLVDLVCCVCRAVAGYYSLSCSLNWKMHSAMFASGSSMSIICCISNIDRLLLLFRCGSYFLATSFSPV